MPFGRLAGRAGSLENVGNSIAGSIAAESGVGLGGSIGGEAVGLSWAGAFTESEPLICGSSKPVKIGRAGRSARREVGCCFFSGGDGSVGDLAKTETGRVEGMVDSLADSIAAVNGVGLGGIIRGEDVGVKVLVCGNSNPVKIGRAGRSARTEVGCCLFSDGD